MSADQRFTLLLAGLSLVFMMVTVILGLIWRAGNKAGETLTELKSAVDDVKNCQNALDTHIRWHMDQRK